MNVGEDLEVPADAHVVAVAADPVGDHARPQRALGERLDFDFGLDLPVGEHPGHRRHPLATTLHVRGVCNARIRGDPLQDKAARRNDEAPRPPVRLRHAGARVDLGRRCTLH